MLLYIIFYARKFWSTFVLAILKTWRSRTSEVEIAEFVLFSETVPRNRLKF